MAQQPDSSILRRKITRPAPDPAEVPLTSSRAIRLAMQRAADDALGMAVTVLGLREETQTLEHVLADLAGDMLLIGIHKSNGLAGFAALDGQLRAAAIEMQTMGLVLPQSPEERPATGTDAMMVTPLIAALLSKLSETTPRTKLEGWADGVKAAARVASVRAAGLALPDIDYRVVRLTLDLGAGDRQAELVLALPGHQVPAAPLPPASEGPDWAASFQASVEQAPAALTAQLHRFDMPLSEAQSLSVGQVVPLYGCSVDSVALLAPGGQAAARARLGQFSGMRAVRISAGAQPDMADMSMALRDGRAAPVLTFEEAVDEMAVLGDIALLAGDDPQAVDPMHELDLPAGESAESRGSKTAGT